MLGMTLEWEWHVLCTTNILKAITGYDEVIFVWKLHGSFRCVQFVSPQMPSRALQLSNAHRQTPESVNLTCPCIVMA